MAVTHVPLVVAALLTVWLLMLAGLPLGQAQPDWYVVRDDKPVGTLAMPVGQYSNWVAPAGVNPNNIPTLMVVTVMDLAVGLTNCTTIVLDLPASRRFPNNDASQATDPGKWHVFLWDDQGNGPPLTSWMPLGNGQPTLNQLARNVWSVFLGYNQTWAPERPLGVYRLVLDQSSDPLPAGRYWLGVYVEQQAWGTTLNNVFWLSSAPNPQSSVASGYYCDFYGNYINNANLAAPQESLTRMPIATVYYAQSQIGFPTATLWASCLLAAGAEAPVGVLVYPGAVPLPAPSFDAVGAYVAVPTVPTPTVPTPTWPTPTSASASSAIPTQRPASSATRSTLPSSGAGSSAPPSPSPSNDTTTVATPSAPVVESNETAPIEASPTPQAWWNTLGVSPVTLLSAVIGAVVLLTVLAIIVAIVVVRRKRKADGLTHQAVPTEEPFTDGHTEDNGLVPLDGDDGQDDAVELSLIVKPPSSDGAEEDALEPVSLTADPTGALTASADVTDI